MKIENATRNCIRKHKYREKILIFSFYLQVLFSGRGLEGIYGDSV